VHTENLTRTPDSLRYVLILKLAKIGGSLDQGSGEDFRDPDVNDRADNRRLWTLPYGTEQ
jgi:hypothetical protein